MGGNWRIPGHPELGSFETLEAALAAAWDVTPPGEVRPTPVDRSAVAPVHIGTATGVGIGTVTHSAIAPPLPKDGDLWIAEGTGMAKMFLSGQWLELRAGGEI